MVDVGFEGSHEAGGLHLMLQGVFNVGDAMAGEEGSIDAVAQVVGQRFVGLGRGHGETGWFGHGGGGICEGVGVCVRSAKAGLEVPAGGNGGMGNGGSEAGPAGWRATGWPGTAREARAADRAGGEGAARTVRYLG